MADSPSNRASVAVPTPGSRYDILIGPGLIADGAAYAGLPQSGLALVVTHPLVGRLHGAALLQKLRVRHAQVKYMAYISQKDDVVDESNDESNDVDQIRENVYDVLNNFGFETIEILCQKYSLDIFNRNMHDLVSGALYNSTCEADSIPGPIGTNPDDKFQFIKEQMIKNGLSECTDHISKMSLK